MLRGLSFIAIFAGLSVDIVGTLLLEFALGIAIFAFRATHGVPMREILSDAQKLNQSSAYLAASFALGTYGTFLGAFLGGSIAKATAFKNALAIGILSALLGVPFWGLSPLWYDAASTFFTLAAAVGGGQVAQWVFGSKSPPLPQSQL